MRDFCYSPVSWRCGFSSDQLDEKHPESPMMTTKMMARISKTDSNRVPGLSKDPRYDIWGQQGSCSELAVALFHNCAEGVHQEEEAVNRN